MMIRQFVRTDLAVIQFGEVASSLTGRCETVAENIDASLWAVNEDTEELLILVADKERWTAALREAGVKIEEVGPADDGVYGNVDLTESFRGDGNVYWIERVSRPTGDLLAGMPEDTPDFAVSHVNPLGETEGEQVRAPNVLAAIESYGAFIFERYGVSHHVHGNGYLAVKAVDRMGDVSTWDVGRDLVIMESTKQEGE